MIFFAVLVLGLGAEPKINRICTTNGSAWPIVNMLFMRPWLMVFFALHSQPAGAFEIEGEVELFEPPVAIAGDDQLVKPGDPIAFDGSASNNDASGAAIVSYEWSIVGGVANGDKRAFRGEAREYVRSLNLVAADTAFPSLALPKLPAGIFQIEMTLELIVTDEDGGVSLDDERSALELTVSANVPAAPRNLTVSEVDGQLQASFQIPDDGGTPVTDVQYRLDGGDWVSTGSTDLSFVIPGAVPPEAYTLAVRAVNAAGAGVASDGVGARFRTAVETLADVNSVVASDLRAQAAALTRADMRLMSALLDGAGDRMADDLGLTASAAQLANFSSKCPNLPGFACAGANRRTAEPITIFSTSARGTRSGEWEGALHLAREFSRGGRERVGWVLHATRSEEDLSGALGGVSYTSGAVFGVYGFRAIGDIGQVGGLLSLGSAANKFSGLTLSGLNVVGGFRSWRAVARLSARGVLRSDPYVLLPKLAVTLAATKMEDATVSVSGGGRIPGATDLGLQAVEHAELHIGAELRRYFNRRGSAYVSIFPSVECEDRGDARDLKCFSAAEVRFRTTLPDASRSITAAITRDFSDAGRAPSLELRWDHYF